MKHVIYSSLIAMLAFGTPALGADTDLIQQLNLSRSQIKKIQGERKGYERSTNEISSTLKEKAAQLSAETKKDKPDEARVKALLSEINGLRSRLTEYRVHHFMEVRKTLTSEQRNRLRDIEKKVK